MATKIGTPSNDTLVADETFNILVGLEGNDNLTTINHQYHEHYDPKPVDLNRFEIYGNEGDDFIEVRTCFVTGSHDMITIGFPTTLFGGSGNDICQGGEGLDFIRGNDGNDLLYGAAYSDRLFGDNGNDTLQGGTGGDTMDGGAGYDVYLYTRIGTAQSEGDSNQKFQFPFPCPTPSCDDVQADLNFDSGYDLITRFDNPGSAGGDRFDFRPVDADLATPGDQAFTFVGTGALRLGTIHVGNGPWNNTTLVQAYDKQGNYFQAFIEDGPNVFAYQYTSADFFL